ncbi:hypothetical protein [Mucilaginibacter sp.]|uniref:HU domain-containing protein n=1 Tax=Mucilaginibacter sp. TaxID=1882438 RepID=UPI0035BC4705
MDVGYFISELLGQQGEVSVPGLGYFAHTRVNGYYNDKEAKFYPPSYSVQFDPQFIDDDALAQHIADNKNISLASSKYFTEKYVAGIWQQVAMGDVSVANLGWFYMDDTRLAFRSNTAQDADPEFFGYPALQVYKLGQKPANALDDLFTPADVNISAPEAVTETQAEALQFETDLEHEQYLVELTAQRRRKTLFVFIGLAIALAGLVYFLYTKYDRSAFDLETPKAKAQPKKQPGVKSKRVLMNGDSTKAGSADDTIHIVKFDQGKKVYVPEPDTLAKKIANAPVELPAEEEATSVAPRYEILGGAVATTADANVVIAKYRRMGFSAHVLDNVPGRKRKITLGTFTTRADAIAAQQKIIATGKIKPAEIYIQPYNVK